MPHAPTLPNRTARNSVRSPRTPSAAPVCICTDAGSPSLLYTQAEAAKILKVSPATLRRWRTQQPSQGPAYVRIGARISYRHQDLADYLTERRVIPGVAA
ncbi:helix-turn-helix domain-containing protein [Kitasatospora sp. NPDC101235]|uniref:helix-turn-helix domain-containing protein n=1 Tax=Kitasatospora sp. NPDC101235 TaxID=3364101 RepID=UPI00382EC617